jgi:hypothetical protein
MKHIALFLTCLCTVAAFGQTLLCEQTPVTVYYTVNKTEDGKDNDGWKIYLDIQNRGTEDLFYAKAVLSAPSTAEELIPGYLKIIVSNAVTTAYESSFYVHGSLVMRVSTDGTSLFKVTTKRHEKTISVRIKKGETPEVTGSFIQALVPKDQIK